MKNYFTRQFIFRYYTGIKKYKTFFQNARIRTHTTRIPWSIYRLRDWQRREFTACLGLIRMDMAR